MTSVCDWWLVTSNISLNAGDTVCWLRRDCSVRSLQPFWHMLYGLQWITFFIYMTYVRNHLLLWSHSLIFISYLLTTSARLIVAAPGGEWRSWSSESLTARGWMLTWTYFPCLCVYLCTCIVFGTKVKVQAQNKGVMLDSFSAARTCGAA